MVAHQASLSMGILQARILEWVAMPFSRKVTILIQMTKRDNTTFNIQKMKIMASGPITSWEIDGETVETVSDFIFGGLQNHCRW